MISPRFPTASLPSSPHPGNWRCEHDQAVATVTEALLGTELATEEELRHLGLIEEGDLIEHWNDEIAKVAGGVVNILHGWTWLEYRKPCKVCGSDCLARDPEGRVRHPACSVAP